MEYFFKKEYLEKIKDSDSKVFENTFVQNIIDVFYEYKVKKFNRNKILI